MKDFFHLVLQLMRKNPSEKQREKHMFPSSLRYNMTGKLMFSQQKVNKAKNLIACCFYMLSNVNFDAFRLNF